MSVIEIELLVAFGAHEYVVGKDVVQDVHINPCCRCDAAKWTFLFAFPRTTSAHKVATFFTLLRIHNCEQTNVTMSCYVIAFDYKRFFAVAKPVVRTNFDRLSIRNDFIAIQQRNQKGAISDLVVASVMVADIRAGTTRHLFAIMANVWAPKRTAAKAA